MKTYTLLEDWPGTGLKKDETVYAFSKATYGLVSDDQQFHGFPFTAVTRDPEGDYPFSTCPVHLLEEVK